MDHSIDDWLSGHQDPNLLLKTARCYEKEYSQPYLEDKPPVFVKNSKIEYLEIADIFNDWTWYDRIMEFEGYPGERDGLESEFMANGLNGYREFLTAVKMKGVSHGPPINIDLFWHSHQLFPKKYIEHCELMFGDTLYHTPLGTVARWDKFTPLL